MSNLSLAVITPVYNDWTAFRTLLLELNKLARPGMRLSVVAVDDGSTPACPEHLLDGTESLSNIYDISILQLTHNMGHQRAIAIGLSEVASHGDTDAAIVMDCDGEDRPQDILRLVEEYVRSPQSIVVARRKKRSEGALFKLFYAAYKMLFRIMTGKVISFGNFCLIPGDLVKRLVFTPELWNNLAGTIVKSRFATRFVPTVRGVRYFGKSKMNFVSLILHGFSIISVFTDVWSVRLLLFSLSMMLATMLGGMTVVAIRILTNLAIPGWASYLAASLMIIFLQSLTISVFSMFIVLTSRSHASVIPALEFEKLVAARKHLYALPTLKV